jgi:hypothetical protein
MGPRRSLPSEIYKKTILLRIDNHHKRKMRSFSTFTFFSLAHLAFSAYAEETAPSITLFTCKSPWCAPIYLLTGTGKPSSIIWTQKAIFEVKSQQCLPGDLSDVRGFLTNTDPSDRPMRGCLYGHVEKDCKGDYTGWELEFSGQCNQS